MPPHNCHRTLLSSEVCQDIEWWFKFISFFNGKSLLPLVLAVVLAANRWAHHWRNKRVIVYSDNSVTVAFLNKESSRNKITMKSLRYLFWLSSIFNFHLTAHFIPGIFNTVADSASRLHTRGFLESLLPFTDYSPLHLHMSLHSLTFLLNRFPHWIRRTADTAVLHYGDTAPAEPSLS